LIEARYGTLSPISDYESLITCPHSSTTAAADGDGRTPVFVEREDQMSLSLFGFLLS